jgi:putative flippase GtrA
MTDGGHGGGWHTKIMLLVRYALAGGLTSGVYILVYNVLVHFEIVRFLSSNLAYGAALLVQYSAHGKFTFGHRETRKGVLARYLVAVGFGLLMAALVSQANTKLYTLPDTIVSLIVMVLVAISNFFFFNFWVYADHKKPDQGTDAFD